MSFMVDNASRLYETEDDRQNATYAGEPESDDEDWFRKGDRGDIASADDHRRADACARRPNNPRNTRSPEDQVQYRQSWQEGSTLGKILGYFSGYGPKPT